MDGKHGLRDEGNGAPGSRFDLVMIGFVIVMLYFLGIEHRAHVSGVLNYVPFLFLLLCPLMHVFMHRGHGKHGHHNQSHRKGQANECAPGDTE